MYFCHLKFYFNYGIWAFAPWMCVLIISYFKQRDEALWCVKQTDANVRGTKNREVCDAWMKSVMWMFTGSSSSATRPLRVLDQWLGRLHSPSACQPAFSPPDDVTPCLKVQWRYWTITAIAFGDHICIMWLTLKKSPPAGFKTTFNIGTAQERQPATRKGDFTSSARDDSLD